MYVHICIHFGSLVRLLTLHALLAGRLWHCSDPSCSSIRPFDGSTHGLFNPGGDVDCGSLYSLQLMYDFHAWFIKEALPFSAYLRVLKTNRSEAYVCFY